MLTFMSLFQLLSSFKAHFLCVSQTENHKHVTHCKCDSFTLFSHFKASFYMIISPAVDLMAGV